MEWNEWNGMEWNEGRKEGREEPLPACHLHCHRDLPAGLYRLGGLHAAPPAGS